MNSDLILQPEDLLPLCGSYLQPIQFQNLVDQLAEIYEDLVKSHSISLTQYYFLRAALYSDCLEGEERHAIERIFYSIRRGLIKLNVDLN